MEITFVLEWGATSVAPSDTLFRLLRRAGLLSVKFGSEDGSDGYSTVLVNIDPPSSVTLLAACGRWC